MRDLNFRLIFRIQPVRIRNVPREQYAFNLGETTLRTLSPGNAGGSSGLKNPGLPPLFYLLRFDPCVIHLMTGVTQAGEAGSQLNLGNILPGAKRDYIGLLRSTGPGATENSHGIDGVP